MLHDDDHRALDRGIGLGLLERFHQAGAQGVAQAVHRRIVHRDDGDAVADGVVSDVAHARSSKGIGRF